MSRLEDWTPIPDPEIRFACPTCHAPLSSGGAGNQRRACPDHGVVLEHHEGIWRCREPLSRQSERFLDFYVRLRRREGWGSEDPAVVRALPYRDLTGRHSEIWRIRAASFDLFRSRVLPAERSTILDLGSGNGWFALRLADEGHRVVAVDLSDDELDGLGATRRSGSKPLLLEAHFDRLPLASGQADIVAYDGSFHYSTKPSRTLREACRVLKPGGSIVLLDSPVYRRWTAGERMLQERCESSGVSNTDLGSPVGFVTRPTLRSWSRSLGIRWRFYPLPLGLRWHLGPLLAVLRGRREPARFPMIVGRTDVAIRNR